MKADSPADRGRDPVLGDAEVDAHVVPRDPVEDEAVPHWNERMGKERLSRIVPECSAGLKHTGFLSWAGDPGEKE